MGRSEQDRSNASRRSAGPRSAWLRPSRLLLQAIAILALWQALAWLWPERSPGARDTPVVAAATEGRPAIPALPPEAIATLRLIARGGPFPYERDGVVFGNREGLLPRQARGWYREYTVPTPGLAHRGARRIVTGGAPPREYWYTDDHYASFRRIEGPR